MPANASLPAPLRQALRATESQPWLESEWDGFLSRMMRPARDGGSTLLDANTQGPASGVVDRRAGSVLPAPSDASTPPRPQAPDLRYIFVWILLRATPTSPEGASR